MIDYKNHLLSFMTKTEIYQMVSESLDAMVSDSLSSISAIRSIADGFVLNPNVVEQIACYIENNKIHESTATGLLAKMYSYILSVGEKNDLVVNAYIKIAAMVKPDVYEAIKAALIKAEYPDFAANTLASLIIAARYARLPMKNVGLSIPVRRVNSLFINQDEDRFTFELMYELFDILYTETELPNTFNCFMFDVFAPAGNDPAFESYEAVDSAMSNAYLQVVNDKLTTDQIESVIVNYAGVSKGKRTRFSLKYTAPSDYDKIHNVLNRLKDFINIDEI